VTAAHATAPQTGAAIILKRDEIKAVLETGDWARFEGCRTGASTQRALRCVRQSGRRLRYSRLAAAAHESSVQKTLNAALFSSRRRLPEHPKVMRPFLAYECTIGPHDGPGIL
jgi:hypothetical protein